MTLGPDGRRKETQAGWGVGSASERRIGLERGRNSKASAHVEDRVLQELALAREPAGRKPNREEGDAGPTKSRRQMRRAKVECNHNTTEGAQSESNKDSLGRDVELLLGQLLHEHVGPDVLAFAVHAFTEQLRRIGGQQRQASAHRAETTLARHDRESGQDYYGSKLQCRDQRRRNDGAHEATEDHTLAKKGNGRTSSRCCTFCSVVVSSKDTPSCARNRRTARMKQRTLLQGQQHEQRRGESPERQTREDTPLTRQQSQSNPATQRSTATEVTE